MYRKVDDTKYDYKELVKKGYDKCAEKYMKARISEKEESLELLIERLKNGSAVLDIGCGSGIPVAKQLSKNYKVVGIDISQSQIELAKENVKNAKFYCDDIMKTDLENESFDGVVSYYAIFHIPKEEHKLLFNKIYNILKPGGYLLVTLANKNEDSYTEDDFFDTTMYWSNYGVKEYLDILKDLNFEILYCSLVDHGYKKDMME